MADVELKSVSKKFGNTEVLHSVDLRVEDHEFVVFVGCLLYTSDAADE